MPPYASTGERVWYYSFRFICGLIFLFLIAPILIVVPLSFNVEPYFSFTRGHADFRQRGLFDALVRRHPAQRHGGARCDRGLVGRYVGQRAVGPIDQEQLLHRHLWATLLATALGTLAAIGLSRSEMPYKGPIMAMLISPMIVPLVITAHRVLFLFVQPGWAQAKTYVGLILAHAVLGTPFVIITVTATLVGFDKSLVRAAASRWGRVP